MPDRNRYVLEEARMPSQWYNIAADLPVWESLAAKADAARPAGAT